ncbi:MAG: endonuclease/exonuclease/phosphatase family protein [Alistipes sp.]|nr:endonuclease/exonuclease/phosphatase family protein [Alistipes sp.]
MKIRTLFIATMSLLAVACNYNTESGCNSDSTFRIMTYNVGAINKFVGEDFSKEDNVKLLADIIKESQSDAVAFQELDSCNTRNNYFQLKALAEACGSDWSYYYGPAINYKGGKYGTGIAVKGEKPLKTLHIPIPVKEGSEARVLTIAEFKNYVLACTHLNSRQPAQVEFLSAEIKRLYGDSTKPVFLGGDMNANIGDETMNTFCKDWRVISQTELGSTVITVNKPCIDFILQFNNKAKAVEVIDSKVIKSANAGDVKIASDHYPVYVDVVLN